MNMAVGGLMNAVSVRSGFGLLCSAVVLLAVVACQQLPGDDDGQGGNAFDVPLEASGSVEVGAETDLALEVDTLPAFPDGLPEIADTLLDTAIPADVVETVAEIDAEIFEAGELETTTDVVEWVDQHEVDAYVDTYVAPPWLDTLCRPCNADDDCINADETLDTHCVSTGGTGSFCLLSCEELECPDDYECLAEDEEEAFCHPLSAQCHCSQEASELAAETQCWIDNQWGQCFGIRICLESALESGLTDCDAPEPGADICDGQDNDCDEQLDEDFQSADCPVENQWGTCPGASVCADGVVLCEGDPATEEACNGQDDDCDGEVDESFPDADEDGIADCMDEDWDGDEIPNSDDNCPETYNSDQANFDGDANGDVCDDDDDDDGSPDAEDCGPFAPLQFPEAEEQCNGVDDNCNLLVDEGFSDSDGDKLGDCIDEDDDGDGHVDEVDCCPLNPACHPVADEICNGIDDNCDGQEDEGFADTDGDGVADCMEADKDGDGVVDTMDNCPAIANPEQGDLDQDDTGDLCDGDTDGDGVVNGLDNCALQFNPTQEDLDQDGAGDFCDDDDDGDQAPDLEDNCPALSNPGQEDLDLDEVGDPCDADDDGDGVTDVADNCPYTDNSKQEDLDQDGKGDACEDDADGDLVPDGDDNCPAAANSGQEDCDGDGVGDVCQDDDDGDGVGDDSDNCLCLENEEQDDADGDGTGDLCDVDVDGDGLANGLDNCPYSFNPGQGDLDQDGAGNPCDADKDGDGVDDPEDNCPEHANSGQANTDLDLLGDACDPDDDDDGDLDGADCAPTNQDINHQAEETCDGIDNNCVAGIDEGFGDLDGDGFKDCVDADDDGDGDPDESDCAPGDPSTHGSAAEVCNAHDDNCNGETDEGFGFLTCGLGVCQHSVASCLDGTTMTCNPLEGASAEKCDGEDNDCDGAADEPGSDDCVLFFLDEDEDGWGTMGNFKCLCDAQGMYSAKNPGDCNLQAPLIHPEAVELCNGIDDDCDMLTDEEFPGLGEPCDTDDQDLCPNGQVVCSVDGEETVCSEEEPGDLMELCNGLDDDCDGEVDEDFPQLSVPCDGPDSDLCPNAVIQCSADGTASECGEESATDLTESCNGLDDDCDGEVDEGFNNLGQECDGSDSDLCANGVFQCLASGKGVTCGSEDPSSIEELCNGVDDDCDAQIDEGFSDLDQDGEVDCLDDDDDGDGVNDDVDNCPLTSNPDQEDANENGTGDLCDGDQDGDGDPNATDCDSTDPEAYHGATEVCDSKDNDCDGKVDESGAAGCVLYFADSDSDGFGLTAEFACLCDSDALFKATLPGDCNDDDPGVLPSAQELCNLVDDDCDGAVDEAFATLGLECDGPDTDECENGVIVCNNDADGVTCSLEDPAGISESCNGLDDDCDALVDEDFGDNDKDGTADCIDDDDDDDGVDDNDDNCPLTANNGQEDLDLDGDGNICDDDDDGDSVADEVDNCPLTGNTDQADADNDGLGDVCDLDSDADGLVDSADNCPLVPNADQTNTDLDSQGDACDADDDGDGASDGNDNCPLTPNAQQEDLDGDTMGDACDTDDDGDGIGDGSDNCPMVDNPFQSDTDSDDLGDACDDDDDGDDVVDDDDNCPLTANNGQDDTDGDTQGDACDADDDGDAVADGVDNCPLTVNGLQTDTDGDESGDACDDDDDGDDVLDDDDNCPLTANNGQLDTNLDDEGDACDDDDDGDDVLDDDDNCPLTVNTEQTNSDEDQDGDACDEDDDDDTILDADDNCMTQANTDQADLDGDLVGDVCDEDDDGDTIADSIDNCPVTANPEQTDTDNDTLGNVCDDDDDDDGKADGDDNCPVHANADQLDTDSDETGDVCDDDDDDDGILDVSDNCSLVSNVDQANLDNDEFGDVCDSDDDGDGKADVADNCPNVANTDQLNTDGDDFGDVCDDDDDGDGVADDDDNCPLTANPGQSDLDGNGVGDACDSDADGDGHNVPEDCDDANVDINPAADEDCDGIDNDCNNLVDDGCDDDGDNFCDTAHVVVGTPAVCPNGPGDCNDTNAGIYPASSEICDGLDNDCGAADEGCDNDGDGFCDGNMVTVDCPEGTAPEDCWCPNGGFDCNDTNAFIYPGSEEICNNVDVDCNGVVDDGCDDDDDSYCDADILTVKTGGQWPDVCPLGDGDCDDTTEIIQPGGYEVCNGEDENCNGDIDEGCDDDNDSYCDADMTTNGLPQTCPSGGGDCDDMDPFVNPLSDEKCNGLDDDCNGEIDEGCDDDDDGHCDSNMDASQCPEEMPEEECWCPEGAGDCNDENPNIHPHKPEICNGLDENCNAVSDEGCDDDNDDFCDVGLEMIPCPVVLPPEECWCPNGGEDCDDMNPNIYPDAPEICNGIDDDCDSELDEGC